MELISTITAKIQIYVPKADEESLNLTQKAYRKACNHVSEIVYDMKNLQQFKLQEQTYDYLRNVIGLKSQMAISVVRAVIARYKSAKSNGHDWSKVEFNLPEYDLVWNRDYSLKENYFSVNTLNGRLKFRYEKRGMKKYFDGSWKFGTAKLVSKFGKWFLHIPMTKTFMPLEDKDVNNVVGIDLGVNFLATCYDSQGKTTFYSGRKIKHKRAQYKTLRKQLQQRRTSSARKHIKQVGQRENRYVTDVNHSVTKALVKCYPKGTCFVLEDLTGVRNATEKVRIKDRYVSVSWAFYQFRMMLEYKAELNGQKVIVVSPSYTSQTCVKCGHTEKANRNKKTHTFCCKNCHYTSNDDRIGAMNLYRKGIEYFSNTVTS